MFSYFLPMIANKVFATEIKWWKVGNFVMVGYDHSSLLGGCPFNGPLSGMKYPTRESPRRDAASPIKYNGLRFPQPSSWGHCAQPAVPYRNIIDWPAVLFSMAAVA